MNIFTRRNKAITTTIEEEGRRIAEQLGRGFKYEGPQYEGKEFAFHWITDPVTGTTFAATSLRAAKRRISEVRKSFSATPYSRRNPMSEEGRISPALVIIPVGLGLALVVGLAAMAWAAPPTPPPGRANLYGKVTDAVTGEPIDGVLVSLNGYSAYTDNAGNYIFPDLEPGGYVGQASKEGYQTEVF